VCNKGITVLPATRYFTYNIHITKMGLQITDMPVNMQLNTIKNINSKLLTNPSGTEHDLAPTNLSVSAGTPVSQLDIVCGG